VFDKFPSLASIIRCKAAGSDKLSVN
jgi:hypothetical protein